MSKKVTALTIVQELAASIGAELLPDGAQWRYRMEIKSESSNNLYVISKAKGRQADTSCVPGWGCGCKGWIYHKKCKHLNAIKPMLLAIDKAEAGLLTSTGT